MFQGSNTKKKARKVEKTVQRNTIKNGSIKSVSMSVSVVVKIFFLFKL